MAHLQGQTCPEAGKPFILPNIYMDLRRTLAMEPFDLRYGTSWSPRQKRPIDKVNQNLEQSTRFFGVSKFRRQFCQKLTWTSIKTLAMEPSWPPQTKQLIYMVKPSLEQTAVKTLAMEQIGDHGQNVPSTRSNNPRSIEARLSPQPKRPIYKVKQSPETSVKTLVMETVCHHGHDGPFTSCTNPGADLRYGARLSPRPKRPIYKVKRSPELSTRFLADPEFRLHFWQKFTWTSIKTLAMEPDLSCGASSSPRQKQPIYKVKQASKQTLDMESVGHHSQKVPFTRSNDPRSRTSIKPLVMEPVGHHGQNSPFTTSNDSRSSLQDFMVTGNSHVIFAKNLHRHPLRPYLWSQLSTRFFGDPKFRCHFCQLFSWTSVKTSAMELGCHQGQTDHLQGQMNHGADKSPILPIFNLAMEPFGNYGQTCPFTRSNDPEQSQLVTTAKMAHLQGQRSPKQSMRFFADSEFRCQLCQNLHGPSFKPYLWNQVVTASKTSHLQGQTSLGADVAIEHVGHHSQNGLFTRLNEPWSNYGANWSPRPNCPIYRSNVPKADLNYGISWSPRPKRPIYKVKCPLEQRWNQLVTTAKMTYLQGQTNHGQVKTLVTDQLVTQVKRAHLKGQTTPEAAMEPSSHHGQNFPFTRSNEHRSSTVKTLDMEPAGYHGQNVPFTMSNEPRSSPQDFMVTKTSDIVFAKNLHGHPLRPLIWSQSVTTANTAHLEGQTNPEADLSYGASWSPRPKRPIYKVKRALEQSTRFFGDLEFSRYFCKDFRWTSVKTIAMQIVNQRGQNGPFTMSNMPRVDLSSGSNLLPRRKRPISKVKRDPERSTGFIGDPEFRRHFCQKYTWTSVKTVAMEPVGHHGQNGPFEGQTIPGADLSYEASGSPRPKRLIFKFKRAPDQMDLRQSLVIDPVGHHSQNGPFIRRNKPRSRYGVSWSPRLKRAIIKVKRASEQTLAMEPVCHHCQNGPFARSNETRSKVNWSPRPKRPIYKVKRTPEKTLVMDQLVTLAKRAHLKSLTILGGDLRYGVSWSPWPKLPIYKVKRAPKQYIFQKFTWTSVKTRVVEPVGHHGQNVPFTSSNDLRSRYGASWSPQPKWPIYNVKRTPEQSTRFFGDQEFSRYFCKDFRWTSVKTIAMELVDQLGQTAYLQCQTCPRVDLSCGSSLLPRRKQPTSKVKRDSEWTSVKTVDMEPVGHHGQNGPFEGQTIPDADLRYGISWSPRLKRPIIKVKQASEQSTRFYGALKFRRHFCQKFTWTSINTLNMDPVGQHGQNGPFTRSNEPRNLSYGASWSPRPKQPIYKNFDVIFAKNLHGPPSELSYRSSWSPQPKRPIHKVKQTSEQTLIWSQLVTTTKTAHYKGQTSIGADLSYGASLSPLPKRPISKVKRDLEQLVTTAKTANLQGQMTPRADHSDGTNWSPRPKRPIYKVKRTPENAKRAHLKGQTIPGADLRYGVSWSPWPKLPIYKVKRAPGQTLVMESFSHHGQNCPFTRSNEHRSRVVEPVGHHGQNGPFTRSNDLRSSLSPWPKRPICKIKRSPEHSTKFYGDPKCRRYFCQKITWNFVKTLVMEPVGRHDKTTHLQGKTSPRADFRWTSVKIIAMELVDQHSQNGPFTMSNIPQNHTYATSWSPWPILNDKKAAEKSTRIYGDLELRCHFVQKFTWTSVKTLVVDPSTGFISDPEFQRHFCLKLTWTSVKTVAMEPVGHHGQNGPFEGKTILGTVMKPVGHHGQNGPFSRLNEPQFNPWVLLVTPNFDVIFAKNLHGSPSELSYRSSWSPQPKRPIHKVKQTSEQTFDMESVSTTKTAHYKGQTSIGADKYPILPIFMCYSPQDFMVTNISDVIFAKKLHGPPSRPWLWSQFVTTAKTAHFQGQTRPGANLTYGANLSSRPKRPISKVKQIPKQSTGFYGDTKFQRHFYQKFTWTSVKTLVMEQVRHHGQNGPFTRSNNPRNR
ncbi:hypothetical protein H5410_049327 [Solanum commersonii]|uniref:Uncharacterized protein n=1 Tax=Solanum commersonii TaxID=4109 RepID=A0A9J5WUB4_SOLCO|nr:hypothetical protein H5410_049327 [Solanum commersonii]